MSKNKNSSKHSEHIFLKLLGLLLLVAGLCFGGLAAWRLLSEKDATTTTSNGTALAEKEDTDVLVDEAQCGRFGPSDVVSQRGDVGSYVRGAGAGLLDAHLAVEVYDPELLLCELLRDVHLLPSGPVHPDRIKGRGH